MQRLTKRTARLVSFLSARGKPLHPDVWIVTIEAAVRFVSVEPLLGPLDLTPWLSRLHWVIVGAESGHHSRKMRLSWARSVVGQCRRANVAVFVKQLGKYPEGEDARGRMMPLKMADQSGADPQEWPEDLRIRQYPGGG